MKDKLSPKQERILAFVRRFVELHLDPQLRGRIDAADVVQDTQMEALRRFSAYLAQPALPVRLWLRQLAHDFSASFALLSLNVSVSTSRYSGFACARAQKSSAANTATVANTLNISNSSLASLPI